MAVRDVLFDLDGCLYAAGNGLEDYCRQRIYSFMTSHLGVEDESLARDLWHVAFRRYNQSLRALRACGFQFDTVGRSALLASQRCKPVCAAFCFR